MKEQHKWKVHLQQSGMRSILHLLDNSEKDVRSELVNWNPF